jgi:hypothetical protein
MLGRISGKMQRNDLMGGRLHGRHSYRSPRVCALDSVILIDKTAPFNRGTLPKLLLFETKGGVHGNLAESNPGQSHLDLFENLRVSQAAETQSSLAL